MLFYYFSVSVLIFLWSSLTLCFSLKCQLLDANLNSKVEGSWSYLHDRLLPLSNKCFKQLSYTPASKCCQQEQSHMTSSKDRVRFLLCLTAL